MLAVCTGRLRLVEFEARIIPVEPAMGDDPTRLALDISNDILVLNLEHDLRRQHAPPMIH